MSHPQTQHKPLRHISLYTPALMAFDIFVLLDHIYNFISYHTTQTISSTLYIARGAMRVRRRLLSAARHLIPVDLLMEPFQGVGHSFDPVDETALHGFLAVNDRPTSAASSPVFSIISMRCFRLTLEFFNDKVDDALLNPPEIINVCGAPITTPSAGPDGWSSPPTAQ